MSTNNFCYENRCVVVTDDDYTSGNIPRLGDYIKDCNRNYPSYELELSSRMKLIRETLLITKIVITSGYYSDACIDFVQNEEWLEGTDQFYEWNISELSDEDYNNLISKLKDKEVKIANKIINRIKRAYGYIEAKSICIMSNGEAVYRKIGK